MKKLDKLEVKQQSDVKWSQVASSEVTASKMKMTLMLDGDKVGLNWKKNQDKCVICIRSPSKIKT